MDHKNQKRTKKRKKDPKTNQIPNLNNPTANLAIRNEHPLLNPFILEMVLTFCKGAQDTKKDDYIFPTLRLVCKLWDSEVCKILRPQTQMPLPRLLTLYPEGLGWKWNRSHKTVRYQYQSPYPDTPEFPNVKITVTTCKVIKDPKVIRWFKVMGGQVKSLHYSSALNCYHQNTFLGNRLQTWCPNLETLHLSGIQCFASLIYIFEGEPQKYRTFEKEGLNCKNLRSLIISVDSNDPVGYFTQCSEKTNYVLLSGRRMDIKSVQISLKDFTRFVDNLPEKDIETGGPFYELIEKQIETLPNNYFEDFIVPKYFTPYFRYGSVDWGVLGLILRVAPLRKIIIRKLSGQQQCRDLTLFLLYQPNRLRETLEHLEFQDNVFVGRDPTCLKIVSLFQYPLKFIRLDNLFPVVELMGYFNNWLESCAGSLNSLEVGAAEFKVRGRGMPPIFEIPALPNLHKFVNRNMSLLPLKGAELLTSCPTLKICTLLDEGRNLQKNFTRWAVDLFCDKLVEIERLGHPLGELKIGGSLKFENVVQLGKALGNLVKVNLEVGGADELECLLEWMGIKWGRVEEFRCLIGGMDDDGEERWNEMFTKHLSKIKSLKILDMDFQEERFNLSLDTFMNGFSKMEGLTSLKINHFGVLRQDKEKIEKSIEHVPFVCLSEMRVHFQPRWLNTARNVIFNLLKW